MERTLRVMRWLVPILLYLALAFDGESHWDENNYLYKAAYASFEIQAPWIHVLGGWYAGRLAHICLLHLLFRILGVGLGPLLVIKAVMAGLMVLAAGSYYWILRQLGVGRKNSYLVFVAFLFCPLSVYLGYKALPEVTAILLVIWAIYFCLRGPDRPMGSSMPGLLAGSFFLLLGTYARVECLLTFCAFAAAWAGSDKPRRKIILGRMVIMVALWLALVAVIWATTGISNLEHLGARAEVFKNRFDPTAYPPAWIYIPLFGGGFWIVALAALARWRKFEGKVAWIALVFSLAPVALLVGHSELRFYHTAIFGFALACGTGLGVIEETVFRRLGKRARAAALSIAFISLVGMNQFLRPLYESGASLFQLAGLMKSLARKYTDPLIFTASIPNTYSLLRVCFPQARIASSVYDIEIPLDIRSLDDLSRERGPWIFLHPDAWTTPPLGVRLWRRLKSLPDRDTRESVAASSHWMMISPGLVHREVGRRGRYVAYLVQTK